MITKIDVLQHVGRQRLHITTSTTAATLITRNYFTQHRNHDSFIRVTVYTGAVSHLQTILIIEIGKPGTANCCNKQQSRHYQELAESDTAPLMMFNIITRSYFCQRDIGCRGAFHLSPALRFT